MIKNYKHIIWDWNGTLLNDVDLSVDIINRILIRRQLNSLSLEEYKKIFTFPIRNYYEKAGLDLSTHSFEDLGIEWMDEYENRRIECSLFEGVENVLSYISGNGIQQSILSAYPHKTLKEIIGFFKLNSFFTHLSGLDNIYASSKIELGKKMIEKIGENSVKILLIGDTIHDYEVAKEIGADCLLVASGHQNRERLLTCNATVVNSLSEIIF
jgi:phosphoglycolate phosphatase